ncbi:hypothetical protein [Bremerella sp. P1]|uniref:hypothetical protein n=1 Tax=Bremerella sp. P1 TaxID=3026424 RepID=UPI0023687A32|nr:hypothetical protein [Bremerella sp. P1]WDI43902.1 hypothetical protein PSR63_08140 [Bremerella sp. P1]
MVRFAIIEVNQSLTIAQVTPGQLPEDTARQERGYLIDPSTYRSYDQAREALFKMLPENADHAALQA